METDHPYGAFRWDGEQGFCCFYLSLFVFLRFFFVRMRGLADISRS